jgi:hypothetical protein
MVAASEEKSIGRWPYFRRGESSEGGSLRPAGSQPMALAQVLLLLQAQNDTAFIRLLLAVPTSRY